TFPQHEQHHNGEDYQEQHLPISPEPHTSVVQSDCQRRHLDIQRTQCFHEGGNDESHHQHNDTDCHKNQYDRVNHCGLGLFLDTSIRFEVVGKSDQDLVQRT